MMYCKEDETVELDETEEAYDYTNEEPLEDEEFVYEEQEVDYCD